MTKRPSHPTLPDQDPTTLPPPAGADDAYSAKTRVATLPENVLSAMREQEAREGVVRQERRTRSGTRMAAAKPPSIGAPPVPFFAEGASAPPSAAAASMGAAIEPTPMGAATEPTPMASIVFENAAPAPAPYSPIPPPTGTSFDPSIPPHPPSGFVPPTYSYEDAALQAQQRKKGALKSVLIVALFALLGGVLAAVLNHVTH